ncbi:MAG: ABC transporter permease [Acidobacteria bacterium]|nr:ABC transporter permease [Acidobacteriota bacterium]
MRRHLGRVVRLTATFLRLLLRDHQIVFWNFGFFLVLLLVFLGFLSGGESAVRIALTASIVTIGVMANALFSVGIGLAAARERGVFRRYWLTPAPFAGIVLASVLARTLIVLLAAIVQVLAAHFLFDVSWRGGAVSWVTLLMMGSVAFGAIGFLVAAFAPAVHVANRMVNLVLIPMMALSGASLPVAMMPSAWADVRWILPAAPLVDGLNGAFVHGDGVIDNLWRLSYLGLWALAAYGIGTYGWRRREV